ncbi:MAG: hypothetical protein AB1657_01515 [Candidatus Micrarchaeota archaeon]
MDKYTILLGVLLLSGLSSANGFDDPRLGQMYRDMDCRIQYTNELLGYAEGYLCSYSYYYCYDYYDWDTYYLLQGCIDDLDNEDYLLYNYARATDYAGFNSEASITRGFIRTCSRSYRGAAREALQNGWTSVRTVSSDRSNAWNNYRNCLGIGGPG